MKRSCVNIISATSFLLVYFFKIPITAAFNRKGYIYGVIRTD